MRRATPGPPAKPAMIRVLSVDDHEILVEGLRTRIEAEPDMEFVGRLHTAADLVRHVEEANADVVLLDIDMPGPDVFEAMAELRRRLPEVRSVLLTALLRDKYVDAAYRAGAWGYLTKDLSPDELVEGIRKVSSGQLAFSDDVIARSRPAARGDAGGAPSGKAGSRLATLTTREKQVLRLIAKGLSRTAIAEELCRSPMTIDNHRKSIMKKLEIHDRGALMRYAIDEGIA